MKKNKTKIFIISGPGGAGKTTLVNLLFKQRAIKFFFIKAVTMTTRKRRPGEREGKDYFFITKEEFLLRKQKKFFLESEKVVDDYYGTPVSCYQQAKLENKPLILCIDVKGGIYLKKQKKLGKIISIFIKAPSEKELYARFMKRAEEQDVIKKRIELAKKELQFMKDYDYVVINKNLEQTLRKVEAILLDN